MCGHMFAIAGQHLHLQRRRWVFDVDIVLVLRSTVVGSVACDFRDCVYWMVVISFGSDLINCSQ